MYCTNCGKEISDRAKFCKFCGAEVSHKSKQENKVSISGNRYIIIGSIACAFVLALMADVFLHSTRADLENNVQKTVVEKTSDTKAKEEQSEEASEEAKEVYDLIAEKNETMPAPYEDGRYLLPNLISVKIYGDGSYGSENEVRYTLWLAINTQAENDEQVGYYKGHSINCPKITEVNKSSYTSTLDFIKKAVQEGEGLKRGTADRAEISFDRNIVYDGNIDDVDWDQFGYKLLVYDKREKKYIDISPYVSIPEEEDLDEPLSYTPTTN